MQPTFFINHGGGPCFFLQPGPMRATWKPLEDYLGGFVSALSEPPRALLVVSAHWEEAVPTVNASPAPPLLFDYQGFPDYTYQITWPAPGSPEIAAGVRKLLSDAGLPSAVNDERGYDHGVFIPLKVAFPDADVPVVQLS
jgi:aromatic ring-opening dioxygenase catalytic subunit (LigB family)